MKKFGEGQQPFYAIVDIPEGDSQELTTVTDQALNSLYGEFFNLLKAHGINPTTTTSADLKQVARAVWSAVAAGNFYIDSGSENVKKLTHARASSYLFKNTNANDEAFTIEFLNKLANTGAVVVNVVDVENNQNHFNNIPLVLNNGEELQAKQLPANTVVKARYNTSINKFVLDITLIHAKYIFDGNQTQEYINKSTVKKFDTVQKMIDDLGLVDGAMVETAGYYTPNDGGGARYLIKDTATDYSIPVANNLHALLSDSFDIRKFGIRNNATLDQTTEIQRMVNYADSRVYEIDFLNYKLMTPKTWDRNTFGGVMGLTFYYPHAIKNLFITHDKTRRLENGHCLINFLPIKNPAFEIYFALENVTFDAWVDNYQKVTDNYNSNYDGIRHGLFCHPAKGSDIPAWGHTPSNISFRFKNIRFTSPAYSYNLTTSGVFSKNTYIENVDGEFLGLYLNFHTKNLHVKNMHGICRHDYLEEGRLVVLNLIHYEAELGVGNVTFDEIFVENASCYRVKPSGSIADKEIWSVFKWHNIGSGNTINKATFINVDGTNVIQGVVTKEIVYKDSKRMSFALNESQNSSDNLPNITVDNCNIYNIQSTFGTIVFLARQSLNNLTIKNSKLYFSICIPGGGPTTINKLSLENVSVDESLDSLIGYSDYTINLLLIDTIHLRTGQSVFWLNAKKTIANNIYIDGEKPVGGLFRSSDDATGTIVVNNLQCSGTTTAAWTYIFEGFASVLIKNSYLNVPYITRTNIKDYKQLSVIPEQRPFTINYDPPSLATATQQSTTVTLTGAKLGDNINVSFNQPLQGTRMWGEVTAPNTVMVHHRNDTGVTVDLPSGALTVKIL